MTTNAIPQTCASIRAVMYLKIRYRRDFHQNSDERIWQPAGFGRLGPFSLSAFCVPAKRVRPRDSDQAPPLGEGFVPVWGARTSRTTGAVRGRAAARPGSGSEGEEVDPL